MSAAEKWILGWYVRGERTHYLTETGGHNKAQKKAKRFDSKAGATSTVWPTLLVGADGPADTTGYKAIRLVPKKKEPKVGDFVTWGLHRVGCRVIEVKDESSGPFGLITSSPAFPSYPVLRNDDIRYAKKLGVLAPEDVLGPVYP